MISKVKIIRTPKALENGLRYIGDQHHPDHADIDIGPEIRFDIDPAVTTKDFCREWIEGLENDNRVIRRGRKRSRLAVCEIIRSPDGADMTTDEESTYLQKIHAAQGGFAVARRHKNRITGSVDFHLYRFKRWDREENPLRQLRAAADIAHEELNAARTRAGGKHVETVVEVRRRKKKNRGIEELASQLQDVPNLTANNLQVAIEGLGHTVTRFNSEGDTISVQHPGSKRAHRYSISGLFERMQELNRELAPVPPAQETPAMPVTPATQKIPSLQEAPIPEFPAMPPVVTKFPGKHDIGMDL
jgi:hypothetical protein